MDESEGEMKRCIWTGVAWKSHDMRQIGTGRVVSEVYLRHISGRRVVSMGVPNECAGPTVGTDDGVYTALVCLFHVEEYGIVTVRTRQVDEGLPLEYQEGYSRSYTMRCHFEAHPNLRSSQLYNVHQTPYGKALRLLTLGEQTTAEHSRKSRGARARNGKLVVLSTGAYLESMEAQCWSPQAKRVMSSRVFMISSCNL